MSLNQAKQEAYDQIILHRKVSMFYASAIKRSELRRKSGRLTTPWKVDLEKKEAVWTISSGKTYRISFSYNLNGSFSCSNISLADRYIPQWLNDYESDELSDCIAAINEAIRKSSNEADVWYPHTRYDELVYRRIAEDAKTWPSDPHLGVIALKIPRIEPRYLFDSPCHRVISQGASNTCVS